MNQPVHLPPLTVVNLHGTDAVRVANNLCTAPLPRLAVGQGCESFFTDVRGKTLGHFCVYRSETGLKLIGAGGQAERVIAHIDRYIIREDATLEDVSDGQAAVLLPTTLVAALPAPWQPLLTAPQPLPSPPQAGATMPASPALAWQPFADSELTAYQVPWWTPLPLICQSVTDASAAELRHAVLLTAPAASLSHWLAASGFPNLQPSLTSPQAGADDPTFHTGRILAEFPWYGLDIDDSNLPQELSRDLAAVSFSKGCYLGQETVARLDALGQVQKKLVHWSITASATAPPDLAPTAGTQLIAADGKTVGRLTSVIAQAPPTQLVTTEHSAAGHWLAIGFARRSHFEPGATAQWTDGQTVLGTATVL